MVLNIARLWALRIPAAWLLAKAGNLGPAGLWWSMAVSNLVVAIAAAIWFATGTWKRTVIEEESEAVAAPTVVGED